MTGGPCAKAVVRCTIIATDGRRFVGQNDCLNAQPVCPRALGEGYQKCKTVCDQQGHAEQQAARLARDCRGGRAYLEGHVYACESCFRALLAIGVDTVTIGAPPI